MGTHDGFLGALSDHEEAISRKYGSAFDLARRINQECQSLILDRVEVKNHDGQAMLVAGLFLRTLEHYQAAILLLEKGMVAAAKVAIRAELEATFALRAAAADFVNYKAIVNDNLRERLELIEKARKYDYPILHSLRGAISDELYADLKQRAESAGIKKKLTVKDLSEQAGLHNLYVSVYTLLSRAAHSLVGDIDAYFIVDTDGEIREMDCAPGLDDVENLLLTAADVALLASDAVCSQFGVGELTAIRTELAQHIGVAA